MKKCPNCQRTFEDSMRFCQSDGTPLVDEKPAVDPYKTMVASKDEIAAAMGSPGGASDPEPAAKVDEEVLQLPNEIDPKKTMYASEDEIRKEMAAHDEQVVDLPPLAPEPPKFSEPDLMPPVFGDVPPASPPPSPPPSPFASSNDPIANPADESPFSKTTPPIPSPFDKPKPSTYDSPPPAFTPAAEPPPASFDPKPFEQSEPAAAWSPPAPIEPSFQSAEPMQTPSISPQGAAGGQNQTLAIVSLVSGVLGLTVCCGALLPSLLGVILGFMAKSKATNDPTNFGGRGLALGGIITGAIGLIGTIVVWVFAIFFNGLALLLGSVPQ